MCNKCGKVDRMIALFEKTRKCIICGMPVPDLEIIVCPECGEELPAFAFNLAAKKESSEKHG